MKQRWIIFQETKREIGVFFSDVHFWDYLKKSQNICFCIPEKTENLRIVKYVLRPILLDNDKNQRITILLEKSVEKLFDEFQHINKLIYQKKENSSEKRPNRKLAERIRLCKFDLFCDLNTNFHLGNAILSVQSKAFVRIGFENPHSEKFFNLELSKTENGFLEETYSAVRRMLCL